MKKWTVTIVREDGVKTIETHASKNHAIAYAEELAEMADAMELDVTITVEEIRVGTPGPPRRVVVRRGRAHPRGDGTMSLWYRCAICDEYTSNEQPVGLCRRCDEMVEKTWVRKDATSEGEE